MSPKDPRAFCFSLFLFLVGADEFVPCTDVGHLQDLLHLRHLEGSCEGVVGLQIWLTQRLPLHLAILDALNLPPFANFIAVGRFLPTGAQQGPVNEIVRNIVGTSFPFFIPFLRILLLFPAVVWPIDVLTEKGGREVVEADEVAGGVVARVGHIVTLRTGIVP